MLRYIVYSFVSRLMTTPYDELWIYPFSTFVSIIHCSHSSIASRFITRGPSTTANTLSQTCHFAQTTVTAIIKQFI